MICEHFGELKFRYRNREFRRRGCYVDTVGKNKARITEYIRQQPAEDKPGEHLSIPYAKTRLRAAGGQRGKPRIPFPGGSSARFFSGGSRVAFFRERRGFFPARSGVAYSFSALSTKRVISEGTPRRQEKPFHRPVPGLT